MGSTINGVVDDLFDIVDTPDAPDGAPGGDDAAEEQPVTAVLRVHVQPGAGRSAATGRYGDALKVRVAAAPEGGRANEATVALVASLVGVKPAQVELIGGGSSRAKRLRIEGILPSELRRLLTEAVAAGNARSGPGVGRSAH
jgi:uncharacterized protein (TIGR00251 family)